MQRVSQGHAASKAVSNLGYWLSKGRLGGILINTCSPIENRPGWVVE